MTAGIRGGVLLAFLCASLPLDTRAGPAFTTERTLEEVPPSSMPGGVSAPVEESHLPLYRAHALAALDALNRARDEREGVYELGDVLEARTQVVAGQSSPRPDQHPTGARQMPTLKIPRDTTLKIPSLVDAGLMVHVKYEAVRGSETTVCAAKVWQKLDGTHQVTSNTCEERR